MRPAPANQRQAAVGGPRRGSLIWDGDWTGFAGVQGGKGFPAEPYKPVLYQGNNTQVSSAVQQQPCVARTCVR